MTRIKPTFFPKQQIFIDWWFNHTTTKVNEVLFGGAAGGGKSVVGCDAIIMASLRYAGSRWAIGRARLSILKQTTLVTFYECCKRHGLEKGNHFKVNEQKNEITFFNGSVVLLKDLFAYPSDRDFDSLGSLEICGGFIDELPQVTQRAFNVFGSRMRYNLTKWCECGALNEQNEVTKRDENGEAIEWLCNTCGELNTGLRPKLGAGCNPSRGWVYSEFYKPKIEGRLVKHRQMIFAKVTDNYKLPKHYIEQLNRLPKLDRERLLLGNWEYSDMSNLFDISKVQDFLTSEAKPNRDERMFLACDVARLGKDRSIIMLMDSNYTVCKMWRFEQMRTNELARKIKKIAEHYGVDEYDIAIDTDGVGGGVADHFDSVTEIMNGSKAIDGENYANLKTQMYFKLAEMINEGEIKTAKGVFTDKEAEELAQELEPIKQTNIDKDGKKTITSKAELKQMLSRSPDYADCLAYLTIFVLEDRLDGDIITL